MTLQDLCPKATLTTGLHHYHSNRELYYGSQYFAICCRCGRVSLITYKGPTETPDLFYGWKGTVCGEFVR